MEANGLAGFVLAHFGKRGFAIYKFVLVILVIIICEFVAQSSIAKARLVMLIGTIVYFGVVLYESWLIYQHISLPMVHPEAVPAFVSLGSLLLKGST
jgi:hypothetical protein